MGSLESIREGNGPQLIGHEDKLTFDKDGKGNITAQRFTDPDGRRWISKRRANSYGVWLFA